MAIDPLTGRQLNAVQPKATNKGAIENQPAKAQIEAGSDSVSITANSVGLASKGALNSSSPPIDEDRISLIRQSLADGSYQVDAEKLAQKIIQFEAAFSQDST